MHYFYGTTIGNHEKILFSGKTYYTGTYQRDSTVCYISFLWVLVNGMTPLWAPVAMGTYVEQLSPYISSEHLARVVHSFF